MIQCAARALNGDGENVKKTGNHAFKNKCVMKDLPQLTKLEVSEYTEIFSHMGILIVSGILHSVSLRRYSFL